MRDMIVLAGPTAVGKTRLSIELAKAVGGEIISADSMQVYRHMDIGSAKIKPEEMQGIPHHMIDILEPWEPFNVAAFKEKCGECLPGIYARGHIPIVAGGTGFYIQALLRDIDFTENKAPIKEKPSAKDFTEETPSAESEDGTEYRAFLEKLAADEGAEKLHEMLAAVDPDAAAAIHANNIRRTVRALEFFHLTGERISSHNEAERRKPPAYNACYFVLNDDRERLYARIGQRVDEMLAQGLVEEVRRLRDMGCSREMCSMQGLGYKEILAWLEGEVSYEQAVEILKRDTRRYAKRQLTWFRREKDCLWINKDEFGYDEGRMLQYMTDRLREKGIIEK